MPPDLLAYESPGGVWREVALVRRTLARTGTTHERLRTYELGVADGEPDGQGKL